MLLINDYMTFWNVLKNMFSWNNIGESLIIFIVLFLIFYKGLKYT